MNFKVQSIERQKWLFTTGKHGAQRENHQNTNKIYERHLDSKGIPNHYDQDENIVHVVKDLIKKWT